MSTNGKNALEPPTTTVDVMKGLFLAGRAAMVLEGPWLGVDMKGAGIDFAGRHNLLMLTNIVNCYRIPAFSYASSPPLRAATFWYPRC